jgi:hypothetical protein
MTQVPPPASPVVRVRLIFSGVAANDAGCRVYLGYSGAAPSPGNCQTLATDIQSAWGTHLQPLTSQTFKLSEVDVIDITTETGNSGQWTGNLQGGDAGEPCPSNCAMNIEFGIARRYRGGKPRMYHPPPSTDSLASINQWTPASLSAWNAALLAFFNQLEALSIGSMGNLAHVNLSYYKGFTNVTNSSGRERAAPTYRTTALVDTVNSYNAKAVIGSQRRRRTSTTP